MDADLIVGIRMNIFNFAHKLSKNTVKLLSLFLMNACQNIGDVSANQIDTTTMRSDGTEIHWSLSGNNIHRKSKILLIAHGSGCAPARTSQNVSMLAKAASEFSVLTIEKYGVKLSGEHKTSRVTCSEEFSSNHTISQRVRDAQSVFADIDKRGLWSGETVLFGGSEGGAVVSILSHVLPETDAVVVLSTGTGLTMSEFFPMVVPPEFANKMKVIFEEIRLNPDAKGMAAGNSYKWWRDILDRRFSDDLLKSNIPILLVHGENDKSSPLAAARATQEAFISAGKRQQLTYWEMKGRDHQMNDPQGNSHMQTVLTDVVKWIAQQ